MVFYNNYRLITAIFIATNLFCSFLLYPSARKWHLSELHELEQIKSPHVWLTTTKEKQLDYFIRALYTIAPTAINNTTKQLHARITSNYNTVSYEQAHNFIEYFLQVMSNVPDNQSSVGTLIHEAREYQRLLHSGALFVTWSDIQKARRALTTNVPLRTPPVVPSKNARIGGLAFSLFNGTQSAVSAKIEGRAAATAIPGVPTPAHIEISTISSTNQPLSPACFITNNGRIGIGSFSPESSLPQARLHVQGTAQPGPDSMIHIGSATTALDNLALTTPHSAQIDGALCTHGPAHFYNNTTVDGLLTVKDIHVTGNLITNTNSSVTNNISGPFIISSDTLGPDTIFAVQNEKLIISSTHSSIGINSKPDITASLRVGGNSTITAHFINTKDPLATRVDIGPCSFQDITPGMLNIQGTVKIGDLDNPASSALLDVAGDIRATNFNTISDKRVKEQLQDIDPALSLKRILQLKPKSFAFCAAAQKRFGLKPGYHSGLIAQEVSTIEGFESLISVYPELLSVDGSLIQDLYLVSYTGFIPDIINAIKALNKRIAELEQELSMLKK